jgi:Flp pilus assembly protein TadG
MQNLIYRFRILKYFLHDQSGNYGIIFGLVMFPVIGSVALAVDYSGFSRQKNYVQTSLDAAALASSKEYASGAFAANTPAQEQANLDAYAHDFFQSNLSAVIPPENVTLAANFTTAPKLGPDGLWFDEKAVSLTATLKYDMAIAPVIGFDTLTSRITSEVAMGNLTVEIALVVDNSGSMASNSKIARLKDTSKTMVDKIFAAASTSNKPDPISFSIVPFAASVNIGAANASQSWMDINGWAPIHNENLDWTTYIKPANSTLEVIDKGTHKIAREKIGTGAWKWKTRQDVYSMLGTTWDGCVEMRPWPHNTRDTVQLVNGLTYDQAAAGNGDGLDALFVPMFAPSEPMSQYTTSTTKSGKTSWTLTNDSFNYANDYTYDYRKADNVIFASTSADRTSNQNVRQNWIWRYQNSYTSMTSTRDPNVSCTTTPITPLTTNKTTIKSAIDALVANGNTNIQEGVAWGWRTLSAAQPFTGGRARTDIDNRKYIIVLTDGENTYSTSSTPNQTTYGAWGYGKQGRLNAGLTNADLPALYRNVSLNSAEMKMNAHTLQTCDNAKAQGITIFSIAFDVSDGSSSKALLNACGGSGKQQDGSNIFSAGTFYYDVSASALNVAMDDIAAQISEMRIKR